MEQRGPGESINGAIRIGIVGLGTIGTTHARALQEIENVQVTAFSGGSADAMADCGWPGAQQRAVKEVIAHPNVDAVAVCTPSQTHARLALAAAAAGKHAVVEKPLATTSGEANQLVRAQRDHGVLIAMVAQRRFEPEVVAVKRLLDAGQLGTVRLAVTQVHWFRGEDYYRAAPWRSSMPAGGSLMNQGAHNVDLLQWLCGPAAEVTAQVATVGHDMTAEDTAAATVRFTSGALGLISTSTATPPGTPATLTLHTSRGVVELGQGEIVRWDMPDTPRPASSASVTSGSADPAAIGVAGHVAMWNEVTAALRGGRRCAIDATEAARTVHLLDAIYRAAESGERTAVSA
ncbi:Gfo/Idh/MocA family protein [Ruania halotolerans]|uniref:Gfo/Idh/MocA family protein n=1 Tax=Ruania halotolerans TaxID=2897773 RepID=UPI001E483A8A|nr:Gfo/Idh/MocA family oxidoreductase [Ruania halotolerans]UFU06902.1 Gfo/Idh/MocA family oxidoreductase [Ruania halotolerans]